MPITYILYINTPENNLQIYHRVLQLRRLSAIPLYQYFDVFVVHKDIKLKLGNELKPRCMKGEGEMGDLDYHMLEDMCGKTASTGVEQATSAG